MARPVDPVRHEERRLQIVDAALTCFARDGYGRATTAAICREAGIGSGTFFHYFSTKVEVLLAILDLGISQTAEWFRAQEGRTDPLQVLEDYVAHAGQELADPRAAGFVRAVGAVMTEPQVARALERDKGVLSAGLLPWVRAAAGAGQVRTDVPPERLAAWLQAVLDGYTGVVVPDPHLDGRAEQEMLLDVARRVLRP